VQGLSGYPCRQPPTRASIGAPTAKADSHAQSSADRCDCLESIFGRPVGPEDTGVGHETARKSGPTSRPLVCGDGSRIRRLPGLGNSAPYNRSSSLFWKARLINNPGQLRRLQVQPGENILTNGIQNLFVAPRSIRNKMMK